MFQKTVHGSIVIVALLMLSAAAPAGAQSIFLEPNSVPGVQLEALRPPISETNFTNLSFSYYLSARIQAGDLLRLRFELPFASYRLDDSYGSSAERRSSFGNPYLGVEVGDPRRGVQGEFGIRLPLVGDDAEAQLLGVLSDMVERLEAHTEDYLPLYLGLNYKHRSTNGFALMLRAVPVLWFYTGDGSGDLEAFFLHSAQAWYEAGKVGVGGGFSGRMILTGDAEGFAERTLYQFGFFANYRFGDFLPGFQVRFPLDADLKDGGLGPHYSVSLGVGI